MTQVLLLVSLLLLSRPAVAQDLPPDILADQYLLEATRALEQGDSQRALEAYRKIEALDTVPPPEFSFFYGKLLVETSTDFDDLLRGERLLKAYVIGTTRDSEYYTQALELLSLAQRKLPDAEANSARTALLDEQIDALTERLANTSRRYTLLGLAVMRGSPAELVAELLTRGHGVNETDEWGNTPLHYAGAFLVGQPWPAHKPDVVRVLLNNGANVLALNDESECPLTILAHEQGRRHFEDGLAEVAGLLLQHGADVNGASSRGNTPLIWAAVNGHYRMVEVLIDHGAALNVRRGGQTALDLAIARRNTAYNDAIAGRYDAIAQLLRASGAK